MLHPYFGTVLVLAVLLGLCLIVHLAGAVLDLAEKIARRRIRLNDAAGFEAETRRLFAQHAADLGPVE